MRSFGALFVSVATFTVLWTAQVAEAAPTAACRNLAKQFGENPELLDTSELARLRTCISGELSSKMDSHRPPALALPPPPPPAPALPPPPPPIPVPGK